MNNYIFLTDDEYTFQPEPDAEPVEIENLQVIGTAQGEDANTAYRNLLAENPHINPATFQRIFCYQLDKGDEESRKGYRLRAK